MRYSVESNASKPISVNGLFLDQLPITRQGATEFTFSRFLVPYLMDFEGIGVFFDEDQVCVGDVWELFRFCSHIRDEWDVAVVKDQPQFEWPSVMAFNCANLTHMTPDFVEDEANTLFDFAWTTNDRISDLPGVWNHCVGYQAPKEAKLYHYTQGVPFWPECRGLPEDQYWFEGYENMVRSVDWIELHHGTKHFMPVMKRMFARYGIKTQNESTGHRG